MRKSITGDTATLRREFLLMLGWPVLRPPLLLIVRCREARMSEMSRYLPLGYSSSRPELTLGLCLKMRSKPDIH